MIRLRDKLQRATKEIAQITADEAVKALGTDTIFVDVRDINELETHGSIPGAIHVPRGSLEFAIDPLSSAHLERFAPEREFIVYCASGMRSLLAAVTMVEMGLINVRNLEGGFTAWRNGNKPIDRAIRL